MMRQRLERWFRVGGRARGAVLFACLCTTLIAGSYLARAHPIVVGDDSAAEWFARSPIADNTAIVARDGTEQGEHIWKDAPADENTALTGGSPDPAADIREVRYTGTATNLFVLVKVASIAVASGANAPQIQLAIDRDRTAGSGSAGLVQSAETDVATAARWEYLVQTRFGSGNSNVALWQSGAGAPTFVGSADDAANGTIELSVPWASLGLSGPPASPLRVTVASFRSDASDGTVDVGGAGVSNALDVVTDYGDPGTSPNTTAELADQRIDYYADATFTSGGEVRAPVVISSFASNIGAPNQAAEWIEVANASPTTVNLSGFKLGDAKAPDDGASMYTFPTGTMLVPGGRFLVARSGSAYNTVYGSLPHAEFVDSSPLVPNMDSFAPWGTSALDLDDAGDVVALLDDANTTVDAVPYGTGSYSGVNAITPAPALLEVQARALSLRDTDNADADFGAVGCSGTKVWTGAGGNNSWFTPANWTGGTIPGPSDHVCIPDTGLATISFATGASATVASLTSNEKVTVVNGTLTLDPPTPSTQPSTVSALDFAGGIVNGDGDLNVTGTLNWTDGEFQAPASTVKLTVGGLTTISNNVSHNVRFRRLELNGGTTWSAGLILLAEGASIRNPAGQTFLAQSGNKVQHWFGAVSSFVNGGTLTKAGAGTVELFNGLLFHNSGSVSVDAGTLQLGGGTSTGSFAVPAGSGLVFTEGTHNLNAGSAISGAGALGFSGGTTNVNGGYTHTGPITLSSSGVAVFAAPLNGNALAQSGVSTVLVVNASSSVASYSFSDGIMEGSGDLNVAGAFTWNGGEFRAPSTSVKTTVGGPTTIGVNTDHNIRFRRLEFNGGATWNAGRILVAEGAQVRNGAGQTFAAQSGANVQQWFGATSSFVNEGLFTKAGAGTVGLISGVQFHNSGGAVSVDAGTLQLGGGTSTGSFAVPTGSALVFAEGTHNLNAGSDISGAGALNFSGGTTNVSGAYTHTGPITLSSNGAAVFAAPLNGNVVAQSGSGSELMLNASSSVASYALSDGLLTGSGDLNVVGAFTWNGGEFRAPSTSVRTTVGGPTTIGVNTDHNIRFRRLEFNGGATWNAGRILVAEGAQIRNPAGQTFAAQSGANIQQWFGAISAFVNEGTFTKAGIATVAIISGALFHNSGSTTVAAGLFDIQGGTSTGSFAVDAGSTLQFNGGTHNLGALSSVAAPGTVRFEGGTANVGGAYDVSGLTNVTSGTVNFLRTGPLDAAAATTGTLTQSGGEVGGDDTFEVTGSFLWSAGTQTGSGETLIDPAATLTIVGANHTLSGKRLLTNRGTATWTSPGSWSLGGGTPAGATVRNFGSWTVGDGQSITNPGGERAFFNEPGGLVRKIGSASGQTANWSAEDGAGAADGTVVGIPSWSRPAGSSMTVVPYGSSGFPTNAQAPAGAGSNFFAGGPTPGSSTISQIVELGGNAAAIDAGEFSAALEGELGGDGAQDDAMTVNAVFMSGAGGGGSEVGRITLAPVLAADRGGVTGFVFRSATGSVPAGTRSARLELVAANASGAGYNNAYADKIKLRFRDAESWLGSSNFAVPFDNDSTVAGGGVQIEHGTLGFAAGGVDQSTGTFVTGDGGALQFGGGHHEIGSASAGSLSGTTVRMTAGSANVRAAYAIARTVMRDGTLAFVKTGAGDTTPATTATLVQSEGNVAGDDRLDIATRHVWTGGGHFGSGETRLESTATGAISGAFKQIGDTRLYRNQGTIGWSSGDRIRMGNCNSGSTFRNEGTFNVTGAVQFEACGGVVLNTGTMTKAAGANTFTMSSPFDNDGALGVDVGTMNMTGGGVDQSTGAYVAAAGATLQFGGGSHTLAAASSIAGAGTLLVSAGTATVNSGSYGVTNTTMTNGTLVLNTTDALDVTPSTTTNFTQSDGTLTGNERLDVSGSLTWTGGGQFGAGETRVLPSATGTFSGAFKQVGDTRTFRNQATVDWTGGDRIRIGNCNSPSLFLNEATLNVTAGVQFEGCGGVVRNAGTIVKSGASTFSIASVFDNDGTLTLNGGTVAVSSGGPDQSSGVYAVGAGTTLQFSGGNHALAAASSVAGAGAVSYTGGTTTVNSGTYDLATTNLSGGTVVFNTTGAGDTTPARTAAFNHSGGDLTGTERVDVSANGNWTGGGQFGTGETRILPTATLAISGAFKQIGDTRVLRNQGAAAWTGGDRIRLGNCNSLGVFRNEGTLDMRFDSHFEGCGGQLLNRGLLKKSASSGTSTISSVLDNTGGTLDVATGTVDVSGSLANYNAGTRTLTGGTYLVTGQLRFAGADIATNAATVVLNGAGSSVVDRNSPNPDAFRNFATNAAAGDFSIVNGRNLFTALARGPNLTNAGILRGTGTYFQNVTNNGTVAPGASAGILTVNGSYTQGSEGTLEIDAGGTAVAGTDFDRLDVTGTANLAGTLTGKLFGGFEPVTGVGIEVLTATQRTGTFGVVDSVPSPLPGNLLPEARYDATSVELFAVPGGGAADDSVSEAGPTKTVTVTLSAPSTEEITVDYATADGTALAGSDYAARSGTLLFPAGDTSKSFEIPITDDARDEPDQTFVVNLTSAAHSLITDPQATITITDNDAEPAVSIADREGDEGSAEPTTTPFVVQATLSAESEKTVTVAYATLDDTASVPADYVEATGTITFEPGLTVKPVTVQVEGDTRIEGDENFFVDLAAPVNATIAKGRSVVTIFDDDQGVAAPEASIADAGLVTETDGPTSASFTVTLSKPPLEPVAISYATLEGSATAVEDYAPAAAGAQVTFAQGEVSKAIEVAVAGDNRDEADETFRVVLSSPDGATLGDAVGTATIVDDDATPVAAAQSVATDEDVPVEITLAATDGDAGGTLSFSILTAPLHGSVGSLVGNRVTYTPAANFHGSDSFLFRAHDGVNQSEAVAVTITVASRPDAPVAGDDEVDATEDAPSVIDVLANDTDADGTPPLGVSAVTQPANGVVVIRPDGQLRYTPAQDFAGLDPDRDGDRPPPATVNAAGAPVDDPPVAVDDAAVVVEDGQVQIEPLFNDEEVDALDDLELVSSTQGGHGTVTQGIEPILTYTPQPNFNGRDEFTYTARDASGDQDTGTVVVQVTPVNDAPTALGSEVSTPEDEPTMIVLDGTDVDGDALTFSIVTQPTKGSLSDVSGSRVLYTPNPNATGSDSLRFRVDDGEESDEANVSISVSPVNDVPVADDDAAATAFGTATDIDVLANDADVETGELSISDITDPAKGTAVAAAGGIRYTPDSGTTGLDTFEYTVADGDDATDTALVRVVVAPPGGGGGDPQFVAAEGAPASEGEDVSFTIGLTASSPDPVEVRLETVSGTAEAGRDYLTYRGSFTFGGANPSAATILVKSLEDELDEADETIRLTVVDSDVPVVGPEAVGTIADDDALPALRIGNATVTEGNTGTATLTFEAALSAVSGRLVNVDYATGNGGATAGEDYTGTSGTLAFAAGQQTQTVSVTVHGDTAVEGDETLALNLSNPLNAVIAAASGTGTIGDDDSATPPPPPVTPPPPPVTPPPPPVTPPSPPVTPPPPPVTRNPAGPTREAGLACTETGTPGRDVILGTKRRDVICGLGGADTLVGLGGNDVLIGGLGNDTLLGGAGKDRLLGGLGHDRLLGGLGKDRLFGGAGIDMLDGGAANDRVDGGQGKDVLIGRAGHDTLLGGPGNDRLKGGPGIDTMDGGAGVDILDTRDRTPGSDRTSGGLGQDRCLAAPAAKSCP